METSTAEHQPAENRYVRPGRDRVSAPWASRFWIDDRVKRFPKAFLRRNSVNADVKETANDRADDKQVTQAKPHRQAESC